MKRTWRKQELMRRLRLLLKELKLTNLKEKLKLMLKYKLSKVMHKLD